MCEIRIMFIIIKPTNTLVFISKAKTLGRCKTAVENTCFVWVYTKGAIFSMLIFWHLAVYHKNKTRFVWGKSWCCRFCSFPPNRGIAKARCYENEACCIDLSWTVPLQRVYRHFWCHHWTRAWLLPGYLWTVPECFSPCVHGHVCGAVRTEPLPCEWSVEGWVVLAAVYAAPEMELFI